MDTLISTVSGAVLALAGTLIAYLLTSRERRNRDDRAQRRQSYLAFMLAVDSAHGALRLVADPRRVHGDLAVEAAEAMSGSGVYSARETLLVTASPSILSASEAVMQRLGALRSAVRGGAQLGTMAYHDAYHPCADALWALRRAARADLGTSPVTPEDLRKPSWDAQSNCDFCRRHSATVPAPRESVV